MASDVTTSEARTDWADLTGFQRDVLRELCTLDKPSGQKLRRSLEPVIGIEINHGRLYPNLNDLVDSGLVRKGEINARSNFYELTSRGRNAVQFAALAFESAVGDEPLATDGGQPDE